MKHSRMTAISFCNRTITKDTEGVETATYGTAFSLNGIIYAVSGKAEAQMYGEKINSMLNVKVDGSYTISVEGSEQKVTIGSKTLKIGDGLKIYNTVSPDYQIIGFTAYKPLKLLIEKI